MGYVRGTRWTDELIKEKVIEVKEKLGLDRMPSRKECANYFHNDALVNAVSRRKKWYKLAEELGLEVKNSETYFGKSYEAKTEEMLNGMGFEVRKMSQNFPYDLLVDCVKVDVKASHLYQGKKGGLTMDEYINRKIALDSLRVLYELGGFPTGRDAFETINNVLATMSAADVAPVVYCRDCKHARKSKEVFEFDAVTPLCECSYMKLPHRWYEYCSWGERREENAVD